MDLWSSRRSARTNSTEPVAATGGRATESHHCDYLCCPYACALASGVFYDACACAHHRPRPRLHRSIQGMSSGENSNRERHWAFLEAGSEMCDICGWTVCASQRGSFVGDRESRQRYRKDRGRRESGRQRERNRRRSGGRDERGSGGWWKKRRRTRDLEWKRTQTRKRKRTQQSQKRPWQHAA